jgi:hypothetical protein
MKKCYDQLVLLAYLKTWSTLLLVIVEMHHKNDTTGKM